jgi:hypothetical protein
VPGVALLLRAEDIPQVATTGVWPNTQAIFSAGMLTNQLPASLAAAIDPDFNSTPAVIPSAPGLNGFPALLFAPSSGGGTNQLGNNLLTPINLAAPGQAFTVFLLAAINSTNAAGTNGGPVVSDRQANINGAGKWLSHK